MEEHKPRKHNFTVGEIHPTQHWGNVEILDATNSNKIRIKFLNTGNTKTCRGTDLAIGKVRDDKLYKKQGNPPSYPTPARDKSYIPAGTQYKTNLYGWVEVVQYITGKSIIVRFLNTGNTRSVQKDALLKGLVHDIKERTRVSREKEKQRKLEKAKQRELKKQEQEKNRLLTLKKREEQKAVNKETSIQRKAEKHRLKIERLLLENQEKLKIVGSSFSDKLGMTFTVLELDVETDFCTVQYDASGNQYEFTYAKVNRSLHDVYDRLSPDFEEAFKQYSKARSVRYYEENREKLLEKALKYQKDNPERANHYNVIRRGKRHNAEGTHTKAQTEQLLVDQNNKCACCNVSFDIEKKHLDHKHPINLGGSNWIENLQWLCAFCNLVKNDSHPDVWEEYSQSEEFKERRAKRLLTL